MTYPLDRLPLSRKADTTAERTARYEMRHEPEAFLDKFFPGWRDGVHLWPPRADGEPRVI